MAMYVFEVKHGCKHPETIRWDFDDGDEFGREDMMDVKDDAVCDLCPDCRWARESGRPAVVPAEAEEDISRVPELLTRHWQPTS